MYAADGLKGEAEGREEEREKGKKRGIKGGVKRKRKKNQRGIDVRVENGEEEMRSECNEKRDAKERGEREGRVRRI